MRVHEATQPRPQTRLCANTGLLLTQDPLGLAGGVNLYAYAGNNPVSFSDPFGLCPDGSGPDGKHTTNVADCPATTLGDAWRLLVGPAGGAEGAETIQAFVDQKVGVFVGKGQAHYDGENVRVSTTGPVDGIAARLVHEGTHVIEMNRTDPSIQRPLSYRQQEVKAWNRALNVFARTDRKDAFYRLPLQRRTQDPQKFNAIIDKCAPHPRQPCQM